MADYDLIEKLKKALKEGDNDTLEALVEYVLKYGDRDTLEEFKRILEDGDAPKELVLSLRR